MKYTVSQIQTILSDYLSVTEPELIFGFDSTVYEITVTPKGCSLSALNKGFKVEDVTFDELFAPNHEILGVCLERDWNNVTLFRCLPDLSDPSEVVKRYQAEKRLYPDQQIWSEAVLNYCFTYLRETYEEKWIRHEPKEQDQPYFMLNDGSFLALTIVPGLHGIVIEIAENENDAYNYNFEDADIIYEGFDREDALRQLKDCIDDCWDNFRKQIGQA